MKRSANRTSYLIRLWHQCSPFAVLREYSVCVHSLSEAKGSLDINVQTLKIELILFDLQQIHNANQILNMKMNRPFKNTRKNLRRGSLIPYPAPSSRQSGNTPNCYDCLSCKEEVLAATNHLDLQRKPSDLFALPEDIIYIILEYLPINTRLAILRHKYNPKIMRHKLRDASIDKLFECARIAQSVLHAVYGKNHAIFEKLRSYAINDFKKDRAAGTIHLDIRKEQFMDWIFVAMKRYTTIYTKKYTPSTDVNDLHMIIMQCLHLRIFPNKIINGNDSNVIEVMMLILFGRLVLI